MNFFSFKKAASLGATFAFLIASPLVSAQTTSPTETGKTLKKAETSKDIIEKAYNLSLQKDRSQAINILVNAIKVENSHGLNTSELKKALQQVSYMFYSDRAQQAYELAVSLRKSDPNGSQQKLSEALRMEPDNLTIFVELQRVLLSKGDCSSALENITKERAIDPFDENLQLLQGQAQACLKRWDTFQKTKELADIKKSSVYKYWLSLEIEQSLTEKDASKAKELLNQLQKLDPKYPEIHYWQWRIASPAAKPAAAQKYLKECKNISPMTYRQYMTEVNLCRKLGENEKQEN